jgi:hypothetical protein
MRTIWKYQLIAGNDLRVRLLEPVIIFVSGQGEAEPVVWIEHGGHNPDLLEPTLEITFIGTGHPVPESSEGWNHVGSTVCGPFVWHVYAR